MESIWSIKEKQIQLGSEQPVFNHSSDSSFLHLFMVYTLLKYNLKCVELNNYMVSIEIDY